MAIDPLLLGTLMGVGKGVLIDAPKDRARAEYEAQMARATPWMGMGALQPHKDPSAVGDAMMQGLAAGMDQKRSEDLAKDQKEQNDKINAMMEKRDDKILSLLAPAQAPVVEAPAAAPVAPAPSGPVFGPQTLEEAIMSGAVPAKIPNRDRSPWMLYNKQGY